MIDLTDIATWPQVNTIWQHSNGNQYQVVMFTNIETDRQDKYPTTVVYRNLMNGKAYSRKLSDWERSMICVDNGTS